MTKTSLFVAIFVGSIVAFASHISYGDTPLPEVQKRAKVESVHVNPDELDCLAKNIYFESRSDNLAGKYAVADVVLNRVRDRRYPSSVCGVIHDGPHAESWKTKQDPKLPANKRIYNPVKNRCQFSWYCDGQSDEINNKEAWEEANEIAYNILYIGTYRGITEGATHYHATYVNPNWASALQRVGRIGEHIFYRWP